MKLLIVDDEPLARERLRRLVAARADCEAVREAANGAEAIACNREFQPDVILMDIRMPGMDGIEAARHISQQPDPPAIVFCTAYEEYAIAAFESRAVGYLLKPVQRERLDAALQAARTATRYQLRALAEVRRDARRFFSSRSGAELRLLAVAEVRLLIADQKYVSAIHPGGRLLLDESLRDIEQEFGARFLRIHRNALVATEHVSGLQRLPGGATVVCLTGVAERAQVSRRHLGEVRQALASL